MGLEEVEVAPLDPDRLESVIGPERAAQFAETSRAGSKLLEGRIVLNVNSTATGGGVAEMLQTLLAYARGAGIDARWSIIRGTPEFYAITKRIHHGLYGSAGDGGPLGEPERRVYEAVQRDNAAELLARIRPGDVVLVHDPQPAGLVGPLRDAGAAVVWRCHVGADRANEWSQRAWAFLAPYVGAADAAVFSRASFAPDLFDPARVHVIPPSIDPFAVKNEAMTGEDVRSILSHIGLLGEVGPLPVPTFTRRDGTTARIDRRADVLESGPPPPADVPLIVQVSRWDVQKDMAGVMRAFAEHGDGASGAHLVLVGPSVSGVTDDPEGGAVLDGCERQWRALPASVRERVHLACLPMDDADENAAMTNAIQRHAAVVTQKSLAEGFGLTVAEAMYKGRPVVASAVGGIVDQVVHEETGLLVDDPHDLATFGAHLQRLLADPDLADRYGERGREVAIDRFLGDRHLQQWAALLATLVETA